ncbi:protein kinase [Nonomuraea sp. NPDC005983]|uniref:serine/threonine-protein kinase n=1 Tax=Nonomuraea sp. NPDC005983 TaxID=3155595 RepID=UPI0033ABE861
MADRLLHGPGAEGGAPQSQGRLIGRRYRLMSPVGRGGMGMVWHAHDVLLARDVAVKELILPFGLDHAGKQVAYRRMLREARSAARLTHPSIVTVHDVVEEDGRPWIVMELVQAWSLEQAVRQSGPLPVVQAAEIGIRVLEALQHAHAAGILHRDVKPGNVLLTADRVVLTDFGIAAIEGDVTITQTGLLMGSPAYVPPERLSGQSITQAADLWSFGATLYAAVEGRPPYEGPDAIAVLGAVLTQEPITPQRAGALLPVIEGLLRKDPVERLTSEQAAELLERVLHAHGSVRPRGTEAPSSLPTRTDSTPAALLPPLDQPSGPMPSRIVETPSGPVRVPYDPMAGHAAYDSVQDGTGAGRPPRAAGFDAFGSGSGPQQPPFDPPDRPAASPPERFSPFGAPTGPAPSNSPHGASTGPQTASFGDSPHPESSPSGSPSAPHPVVDALPVPHTAPPEPKPILPLGGDSRATPWPMASPDDLRDHSRELARDLDHRRTSSRSGQAERATKGRRSPDTGGWLRDGRPTIRLIVTGIAAAGAVTAVVLFATSGGSHAPKTGASTSPTSAAAAQPEASPPPEGYKKHTPAGLSVAVPANWKAAASGGRTTFTGPKDSGIKITVEQAPPQPDGGLSELGREEAAGRVDGYIQVQLQRARYRTWKAADWEYTYTLANGVPMHALTRHVTIDDSTAFKITFDMPELKWDDQAQTRRVFFDTFHRPG